ncbi:MAG: acetate--CoA ligase family protein [Bacteroidetes bacterium]|nr:acetate--CoA ligase family protein [Bacteroidota bacterium]MBU1717594.1 acetate--CoA ligase family protein [Bacteroidota bacterium]
MKYKNEMYKEWDFRVKKFYHYTGPNYYLDTKAVVFNIFIAPNGDTVAFYKEQIAEFLPQINEIETPFVIDLFVETLMLVLRMDINLFLNKFSISPLEDDEFVVAVEYLDKNITIDCVYLVSDWFKSMSNNWPFDFPKEFHVQQAAFDKTLFGGPTLYSLVEAGLKRNIPVLYQFEENQFQWGYGIKQLRGRSTTFHTDGIKDTEFTMFKDMVGDFLIKCGFPTPTGKNCFAEDEIVAEAKKIGYPVVVKPVAGHKGQGVTTGIETEAEVRKAYNNIIKQAKVEGIQFEGALVQNQIYGTDHRLISVEGKFVAALERVPAFIVGDGEHRIKDLIDIENQKEIRLDNARSPLCKIKIDDNLMDYLKIQSLTLDSIPKAEEKIILRRVANISAGGVSVNVTEKMHPLNIKLVEDIASFFNVKCMGIDVLVADISKPWTEGNFGIIEINAGPGVFMHLAPAYGGSIDVPGLIIESHFKNDDTGRIPIIIANKATLNLAQSINHRLSEIAPKLFFASLTEEGIYFNGLPFYNNPEHQANIEIILRHPKVEFALFKHNTDDIYDFGLVHEGANIVILDEPSGAEVKVLETQLIPGGLVLDIEENEILVLRNGEEVDRRQFNSPEDKDMKILEIIEPEFKHLIDKYL